MRRIVLLGCVAAASLTATALGARLTPGESWIGSQNGWTATPPKACSPRADVCSTEDGGATWHGIFNGGTFIFGVVRTSPVAGVVSTGRQASARFWTRDNGHHWYRTQKVGPDFQGSGPYVFWIDFRRALHQVQPWPPRAKARCRGVWAGAAFETAAARRGNVCSGPAVEAGMRSRVVVRLEEGTLVGLANVPGGVMATIADSPVPRVLLYRLGKPRVLDLPPAADRMPCTGFNGEPVISWPRIAVIACAERGTGSRTGVWVSDDGGASWSFVAA